MYIALLVSVFIFAGLLVAMAKIVTKAEKQTNNISVTAHENLLASREEAKFLEQQKKEIRDEIKGLEKQLEALQSSVTTFKTRSTSNLPVMVEEVVVAYEKQGIALPLDIIEELGYVVLENKEKTVQYIEAQRTNWKTKNTQKFVKGLM